MAVALPGAHTDSSSGRAASVSSGAVEAAGRANASYGVRAGAVVTPHTMNSVAVINALTRIPNSLNRFAVNLGAGDGISCIPGSFQQHDLQGHADPTYPLFKDFGYAGLAVEGNAAMLPALNINLPSPSVKKVISWITPDTVVGLLQQANTPLDMDYFKNDLDAYDCAVTYSVLKAGYRPKVVHMEVNSEIPYPVAFGVNYADHYKSNLGSNGFYGCSVGMVAGVVKPFGYEFVGVSPTHDVLLVRKDLLAGAGLAAIDDPTTAQEEVTCCLAAHFGPLGNYAGWNAQAANPALMLQSMQQPVAQACIISQGVPGQCPVPYTLSLNPLDFVVQLEQILAAKKAAR